MGVHYEKGPDHPKENSLDLDQEIETVVSEVKNDDKKYDVIIIDEAQDFSDEWMISIEQMLRKMANFMFFMINNSLFLKKVTIFFKENSVIWN